MFSFKSQNYLLFLPLTNITVIRGCNNTRTFTRHNGANKCTNYTGHFFYTDLFIIVINFDLTLNVVVVFSFVSVYTI